MKIEFENEKEENIFVGCIAIIIICMVAIIISILYSIF
jgi:hypothetical protein